MNKTQLDPRVYLKEVVVTKVSNGDRNKLLKICKNQMSRPKGRFFIGA